MTTEPRELPTADARQGCSCKVDRTATRYGLSNLDEELVSRWLSEEDSHSLRDLEEYVNVELIRTALESEGEGVIDGEAANYYRLLTDDETSEGNRVEARRRLERRGVDTDELLDSFVSHQTIHSHLRECLDVTYEHWSDPAERVENAHKFVRGLQSRTERITRGTLEQLRDADVFDLEEFDVFVDVMVNCERCGRIVSISDVFENEGCPCRYDE